MSAKSIKRNIQLYADQTYRKLTLSERVLGDAPFNRRCHINAVQKVKEGKAEKVFVCLADTGCGDTCVHFINQLADGTFQDNTWGWVHELSNYYLIREVHPEEYPNIWDVLGVTKKLIVNKNSNWLQRWFFNINAEELI